MYQLDFPPSTLDDHFSNISSKAFNTEQNPTNMPSETSNYLETLLASTRPFLRGELESIDKNLPSLVSLMRSAGVGECWHKQNGSYLDHLADMYRILKIWKAPESVCLCGLFHTAYSTSLPIFVPNPGRDFLQGHVGEAAERLIHLFSIVPRQTLIQDGLLFKYSDTELVQHLIVSETSLKIAKEKGEFNAEDSLRKKINSLLPAAGITVKHIKTGEDVVLTRRVVAIFLMMRMGDFSDQFFSFQDSLLDNSNGRLEFSGNNVASLWPGDCKPGLWINSVSRLGAIYTLIRREEEIFMEERKKGGGIEVDKERDENIELAVPPVFDKCTKILDARQQIEARDFYWEAVCDNSKRGLDMAEELLLSSIEKNPFGGEPHVVLAQVYLTKGMYEEAEREAEKEVSMMLEWGSPWDKRMSWESWIAWGRVLLMKAKEKSWPNASQGIITFGLVF